MGMWHVQASMVVNACYRKNRTTLEFTYHLFNNKLRSVNQLMCHFDFDITAIEGKEQGRICFGSDKTLAELIKTSF